MTIHLKQEITPYLSKDMYNSKNLKKVEVKKILMNNTKWKEKKSSEIDNLLKGD